MLVLKKVTLAYVPEEDRIAMTAETDDARPVRFWLTQRICRNLYPVLCERLEQATPQRGVIGREMQLSVSQREAEWSFESSEPVQPQEPPPMFLPLRIDYTFSGDMTALAFPVGNDDRADFRMTMQELRQFMAILYRLFMHAGWPTDAWPSWLSADEPRQN